MIIPEIFKLVMVTTTFPDKYKDLNNLLLKILENKWAVCLHLYPSHQSLYLWEDEEKMKQGEYDIIQEDEQKVVIKTSCGFKEKVCDYLKQIHPYDVPFISVESLDSVDNSYLEYAYNILT